jgi:hypothetical protein
MIQVQRSIILLVSIGIYACSSLEKDVSFNEDIRPILNRSCLRCHGGVRANGGFSLLFEEDAFAVTESGLPAIVRGDRKKSQLYQRLIDENTEIRMPLEGSALEKAEIELIGQWIDQGAKWEKHWAYIIPDSTIQPPQLGDSDWAKNPIDQFIYHRLLEEGLTPSLEADQATLLRRVFFDLAGLPPSLAQVDAFLADRSPSAYENMVDHLLASEHFGERWATMWLDLARYADTKGYEKDSNRSIWKYRDWVIKAFNEDMPFDQFTIEQLAGDLLTPLQEDQLVATAFHRNAISNDEGGTDDEEFRVASVIDRVATTYEVWQGTTMACVQCHSHPYDPFRQEDFYHSMAFFNNCEDRDIYNEQPKFYHFDTADAARVKALISWINQQVKSQDRVDTTGFLFQQRAQLLYQLGQRVVEAEDFDQASPLIELIWPDLDMLWQVQDSSWIRFDQVDLTSIVQIGFKAATILDFAGSVSVHLDDPTNESIGEVRITRTGHWEGWQGSKPDRPDLFKEFKATISPVEGVHDVYFRFWIGDTFIQHLFYLDQIVYHEKHPKKQQYGKLLEQKLVELAQIPTSTTPIIQELPAAKARKTYLYERGSWLTPGAEMAKALPAIFVDSEQLLEADRLQFARWLVSSENPLTARVAVNRFWAQIFGNGLVTTMEEFGSQGALPSHPELLDWLAVYFSRDLGWSMKKLVKLIVTSATYRQASQSDSLKQELDPSNQLLSHGTRTRLSAEQIRDQILAVSGLLETKVGGPSIILPELNISPAKIPRWAEVFDDSTFRRTLYTFWRRTDPFPSMMTFDSPDRTICMSNRVRTNTPLQALNLLNDETYFKASQRIASTLINERNEVDDQISLGYRMVMGREITPDKRKLLKELYHDSLEHLQHTSKGNGNTRKDNLAALTMVANALLNLDEFVVKG